MELTDNPDGLAAVVTARNLVLHRQLGAERQRLSRLSQADPRVRDELGRGVLTSETAAALRLAQLPTSRLNSVVRQEIQAGRWSLDDTRRPSSPSSELSAAFTEISALWQDALAAATTALEDSVSQAASALDEHERDFTRMVGGERPVMSPFSLPHKTYVGAARTGASLGVPRWLGQLAVLPEKPWGHLPWTDLADHNLVFLPDEQHLLYWDAVAAVQSIVADQMSRSTPDGLKITWIDGMHQGQSAGTFLRLTEVGPRVLDGQVWTDPSSIEAALLRVANRVGQIQQSCLKDDLPHLDAYNERPGVPIEAHHLVVVTGYPHGFQPRSATLLRQVSEQSYRTGVSVLVVMHPMMASIAPPADCAVPYYATMGDGALPDSAPAWCTFNVIPRGEPVLGRAGQPYARVFPHGENAPVWMPYAPRHVEKADQEAILLGYVRASARLVATGLSPRELAVRNLDPEERITALRKAMLTWLHEQSGRADGPRWEEFLTSDAVHLTGATFTAEEISRQAKYLQEHGLVFGTPGSDSPMPVLTSTGEDLSMRKDVTSADFAALSGTKPGDTYTTIIRDSVTVSQVTVGRDNTVTQHQHIAPGFEELAAAVRHVAELLPRIGLPAPDAEDAAEHVSDVIAETSAAEPDRGRLRRALKGLRTFLQPVADQAVLGAGEGAHELAKEALDHLHQFVF